jgi:hypothetical protein
MTILRILSKHLIVIFTAMFMILSLFSVSAFAQLTPNTCPDTGCPTIDVSSVEINSREDIARFIIRAANLLTYVVIALSVLMIVYAAFLFVIGKADVGWAIIKNCIIGVIVAILAYSVVNFLSQTLQGNLFSLSDLGF